MTVPPAGLTCFKTYDVRGRVGFDLDTGIARRIGAAAALTLKAKRMAIGGDARLSTPSLKAALAQGIVSAGCEVIDLGQTGTEVIYFASMYLDVDGGIEVTASHNPADHNGFKFIGRNGRPLSDEEFLTLRRLTEQDAVPEEQGEGQLIRQSLTVPYVDYLMSQIDLAQIRPLRLVADVGNGAAGEVLGEIRRRFQATSVPVQMIAINEAPDGNFPNGVPNPLLPEKRKHTISAIHEYRADLAVAWDGDFDRCFFFDADGRYVSGYYITGLLMQRFIDVDPASKFILDSRLNWNSRQILAQSGATGIQSRTGHRFFKEAMRREGAVYGGEVSAHHYFKNFANCDSGMLPWLMLLEHLGRRNTTLAAAVTESQALFPSSEEINFTVDDPKAAVAAITAHYRSRADNIDETDGVSIEMGDVRFNLRGSNTEHLLRLNVEAKASSEALASGVAEITSLVRRNWG